MRVKLKTDNEKLREEITERKQIEEALRQVEQEKSAILNSMSELMVCQDANHRILWANKAAAESVALSIKQLVGRRCYEVWYQRNKPCVGCPVAKARATGKPQEMEKTTPDGRGWLIRGYPLRDANGHLFGVVEVTLDITKRKQAEEALQAEKNKLQSLIDAMKDGLTIQDRDYNIIFQNETVKIIFGDRVGEKCYQAYEGQEKVCEGCPVEKAFRDGKSHTAERRVVTPSGEVTFWENTANPIRDAEGKIVSCLEVVRNITERKQAEEKEKQLQQELYLARKLASVGELAAGVAHEINNPLTGVLGFSQRLMRKSTDEELSRDLEIIHSEAQRAAGVVRNLLAFARRRQPKKEYSNINDIVNKTLELRGYALQTANIEVVTNLAPSLPQIMVDFSQMQEVFLNIIMNAEQAMNEAHGEGKLTISTRRIKDYVRVSFADDGPGISPGSLDKVFDPFFTTRAEVGGSGLGLSACHGIVTEHGGKICVRSKPGEGATFSVKLPLSPVESTSVRGEK